MNVLSLDLKITQGCLCTQIYDKRYNFSVSIVNIPFLDVELSLAHAFGVNVIPQLVLIVSVCIKVSDFNGRNLHLAVKLWR